MTWRPPFERMVEMDSPEERADYARSLTGLPAPNMNRLATSAAIGLGIGWLDQMFRSRPQASQMDTVQEVQSQQDSDKSEWANNGNLMADYLRDMTLGIKLLQEKLTSTGETDSYRAHIFQRYCDVFDQQVTLMCRALGAREFEVLKASTDVLFDAWQEIYPLFFNNEKE